MSSFLNSEIASYSVEPEGNFIEKFLYCIQSAETDPKLYFLKGKDGEVHLFETIVDLFVAGKTRNFFNEILLKVMF